MPLELLVERYNNISFLYIEDLGQLVEGSPLKRLLENNKLDGITFGMENYSDILRILLLYLYGGIYFDLDVISVDEFAAQLPVNFAVAEDPNKVNGAILRFSKGHHFLWFLMEEIVRSNVFITV